MKKKNLILTLFIAIASLMILPLNVFAAGTATVSFAPNANTVAVGANVTVTMKVSSADTTSGVVAFQGVLDFDSNYLQYVSSEGTSTPYDYLMNESEFIIAAMDTTTRKGIKNTTNVYTFVFKTLKKGTTKVTLKSPELSDKSSVLNTNIVPATINIGDPTPVKNSDATLKSLAVAGQTLSPSFSSGVDNYTVNVPAGTTSVDITGAVNNSKSKATGFGKITLTGDTTTATIKVTAEDGTVKNYNVRIVREAKGEDKPDNPTPPPVVKSSDATLKSLNVSGYTMSPAFNKDTLEYSVNVPNGADAVIVNAIKNNDKAKVEITGANNLKVGNNKVNVKVTAEDGTVKNYVINVNKAAEVNNKLDDDATLKSLSVSGQKLSPAFKSSITSYTVNVSNDITSLEVLATPNSDKAKVSITGNTNLKEGVNTINVKVTAENGTVKNYSINVIRASAQKPSGNTGNNPGGTTGNKPSGNTGNKTDNTTKSSDSSLKSLDINSTHSIDTPFSRDVQSYAVTVPYEVDHLDLSYVTNNSKAKVTVKGNENFKIGEVNTVIITVTAEDGSSTPYILNVTRSSEVSGTDLEKLVVNGEDIYDPEKSKYEITVDGNTDKLDIEAVTKDKDSKVEILGNEDLKPGKNTVLVKVTDKDGMVKFYELEVTKEEGAKGSNYFLGLSPTTWGIILGALGLLLLLFLLLFLLLHRKKDDEKEDTVIIQGEQPPTTPVIDFKPEFNFGSKNSSDDDVVHGDYNLDSEIEYKEKNQKRLLEAEVKEVQEIPYDPYDETITKDEIVDAIHEAVRTKDTKKLRMLLDQDELNQRKKELKSREQKNRNNNDRY